MLSWPEVERQMPTPSTLEELAIDDPEAGSREPGAGTPGLHLSVQPVAAFQGRIQDWVADVRSAQDRGDVVLFVAGTHGRAERTVELLRDYDVRAVMAADAGEVVGGAVIVAEGWLSKGFRLRAAADHLEAEVSEEERALRPSIHQALQVYAETDIFEEEGVRHRPGQGRRGAQPGRGRAKSIAATFLSDLRDLKVGDLIVHVDHGIGQFVGLKQISLATATTSRSSSNCATTARTSCSCRSSASTSSRNTPAAQPPLDRLGGTTWEKAKTKVKKAMRDMAEELLKLYAARRAVPGHAFSADTHWQEEFEGAFAFDLTPDQATAVADIKRDMESPTPMDRLLCGDVGYGKTEVAMRAAFKAVMDGKQVAVLAPTTVLAFQHLKTLRERFAAFPARIDMVSRFRTKQEISRPRSTSWPPAASTSSSARIACCRRTSSSATSACSSSTRSSASAWRTRSASSRCARRSTC